MGNTHYLAIAGDTQHRGPDLGLHCPTTGLYLSCAPGSGSGTVELNTIARGAVSTVMYRVVRIIDQYKFELIAMGSGIGSPPGVPGGHFAQNSPPLTGEVVNFDNGATRVVQGLGEDQRSQRLRQLPHLEGTGEFMRMTPDDSSDTVFWYPDAKVASTILIVTSTITGSFVNGDRITTSSGGAFTIVQYLPGSPNGTLRIIRRTGTVAAGDVLTNTTRTGGGTLAVGAGAVEVDHPIGCWGPHHVLPNVNGLGTFYERVPWGDGGGVGVFQPMIRSLWKKWVANQDANERGARLFHWSTSEPAGISANDATVGGVSVQRVPCTGTFPLTWTIGEKVTRGSWSATVWGYHAANKWLYVVDTNGEVLTAGTITGATSGSIGTAGGACIGWHKGSTHWNAFFARWAEATTQNQTFSKALWNSQPAKLEGLLLAIWESEMAIFAATHSTPWPTVPQMVAQWTKLIASFREQFGDPNLPIALLSMDARSNASTIQASGLPFAVLLKACFIDLTKIPGVNLASSEGMQPWNQTGATDPTTLTWVRPQDYRTFGERAWNALRYGSLSIPPGLMQPFPLLFLAGHSWLGRISPVWLQQEKDPDQAPSIEYQVSALNSIVPTLYNFHHPANEWRVYDAVHSANTFGDSFWSGIESIIGTRFARRFAAEGEQWGEVGIIKCQMDGASVSATAKAAHVTFDPLGSSQVTVVQNMRVTTTPASGMVPALGRFTASVGAFPPGTWVVGGNVQITGSLLGQMGLGGNNSPAYRGVPVHAVAPDGSWIDLIGGFVPEVGTGAGYLVNNGAGYSIGAVAVALDTGAGTILAGDRFTFGNHATVYTASSFASGLLTFTPALTNTVPDNATVTLQARAFTLAHGPFGLAPMVEQQVKAALIACTNQLNRVPFAVAKIGVLDQVDLGAPQQADYGPALTRFLNWMSLIFDMRPKGSDPVPQVLIELPSHTGWPTSDENIAAMQATQRQIVAGRVNTVLVPTSDLPMEHGGSWPRTSRLDNGIHLTNSGSMRLARRIDYYLSKMPGIPAHPDGEDDSLAFGAVTGGGTEEGTEAGGGTEGAGDERSEDGPGTSAPVLLGLTIEDGTGIANADSYITVEKFREWAQTVGNPTEVSEASDEQIEAWLRLSARWGVDAIFTNVLTGQRKNEIQALEWPRLGAWHVPSRIQVLQNTVPETWKWAQFWYGLALALGIDPMEDVNIKDSETRGRFATSTSDSLPGGFQEQRTYGAGVPRQHVLPRMCAAADQFCEHDDSQIGVA